MTAAAIKKRGPRWVLCGNHGLSIRREDEPQGIFPILAKSYSLSYLKRLRKQIILTNRSK